MKYAVLLSALLLVACQEKASVTVSEPQVTQELTYNYLIKYPLNCEYADTQLAELKSIQAKFNFDPDPDQLSQDERAWNAAIKSNIWWFAYRCNKS